MSLKINDPILQLTKAREHYYLNKEHYKETPMCSQIWKRSSTASTVQNEARRV
jgi:hypothetical protein